MVTSIGDIVELEDRRVAKKLVALLQRFEPADRDKIILKSKIYIVEKGDTVYKEGDPAHHLYFIESGEVRIFKNISDDKEITIFIRRKQDAFGETGVFTGTKYTNTAKATKRCKLYVLQKKDIVSLIKQNGKIGLEFTKWLTEELEISKAKIRDYLAFGTEGAIASIFIRYSNMYGVISSEGISITEPIKLKDVSKHIGVSRETVSRIVNKWKENGVVTNINKQYVIKDIDYLTQLLACDTCAVKNCVL